jgi:hypothetical protein
VSAGTKNVTATGAFSCFLDSARKPGQSKPSYSRAGGRAPMDDLCCGNGTLIVAFEVRSRDALLTFRRRGCRAT